MAIRLSLQEDAETVTVATRFCPWPSQSRPLKGSPCDLRGFGSCEVRCDHRPKMVHPAPDGLIEDHDPAFCQQIFDVAEAQREPNIESDRVLHDFGRKAIAAIADFDHRGWYGYRSVTASPPPT